MSLRSVLVASLFAAGCGRIGYSYLELDATEPSDPNDGACAMGPWSTPTPVTGINSSATDWAPWLSPDGLTLYLASNRSGGAGRSDIWVAKRANTADAFEPPAVLTGINTSENELDPELSQDELTILFSRRVADRDLDIFQATRETSQEPFSTVTAVAELNTVWRDNGIGVSRDLLTAIFSSDRDSPGISGLYQGTRQSTTAPFGDIIRLDELFSGQGECCPVVLAEGKIVMFESSGFRSDGNKSELAVATRTETTQPFSAPRPVDEINTQYHEVDAFVSSDGMTLLFASNRPGGMGSYDIYESHRDCQ